MSNPTPILTNPVEERPDGSLLLNIEQMTTGTMYTTRLAGETVLCRKNDDGSVSFFALVKRRLPWSRWKR